MLARVRCSNARNRDDVARAKVGGASPSVSRKYSMIRGTAKSRSGRRHLIDLLHAGFEDIPHPPEFEELRLLVENSCREVATGREQSHAAETVRNASMPVSENFSNRTFPK